MSDLVDLATDHAERLLEASLAKRVRFGGVSRSHCLDCETRDPAAPARAAAGRNAVRGLPDGGEAAEMKRNPFVFKAYGGIDCYYLCAEDRMRAVAGFDLAQCRAALEVEGLQKSVRLAIERRMRKLQVPK